MAHPEDVDPENEFLENEKKKDPMEFAKEYMEFANEYMNEMKEARKRRDEERAAEAAGIGEAYVTAPVGRARWHPPRPQLTFTIQQIENGFVVLHAPGLGMPPTTEYAPDPLGVDHIVNRELHGFLDEVTRPRGPGGAFKTFQDALKRGEIVATPPSEAGKGLPPGSSLGMTSREGPPPVQGPLGAPEGPLGPLEP